MKTPEEPIEEEDIWQAFERILSQFPDTEGGVMTRKIAQRRTRKIVQIAFKTEGDLNDTYGILYALCDDGTIWYLHREDWIRWDLPPIPQEPIEEVEE